MRQGENIWPLKTVLLVAMIQTLWTMESQAQQKMQFTQYMFNGLVINPAYAGADEALSLTFIQRSQWAGVENAPSTQTLSAHTLFKKKHFGVGITIVNDKIGVHKNLSVLTNYAYHLRVAEKSYFSMGIQAGINNLKSDYASLVSMTNNDPKLYDPILSRTFFDFGAGVYFRSPRFHAGISVPELLPQQFTINDTLSVELSKMNFFFFSRYRITLNENIDLEPSGLIKYLSGVPVSFDANLNMIYRKVLTLGLSYRRAESVDFLMKAQVTPQLQLGYAYDFPIGVIARLSSGSHELMVQYVFRYVQKNVASPR
jgi:type IX secretion system PorP/SprF family membrane protein